MTHPYRSEAPGPWLKVEMKIDVYDVWPPRPVRLHAESNGSDLSIVIFDDFGISNWKEIRARASHGRIRELVRAVRSSLDGPADGGRDDRFWISRIETHCLLDGELWTMTKTDRDGAVGAAGTVIGDFIEEIEAIPDAQFIAHGSRGHIQRVMRWIFG
jgi:hypothetical protein